MMMSRQIVSRCATSRCVVAPARGRRALAVTAFKKEEEKQQQAKVGGDPAV
jgi:hypothetical protein